MGVLTFDEAKLAIGGLPNALSADDIAWLDDAVAALAPALELYTGPITQRSATWTASGGLPSIALPWQPLSITSVTVNGQVADTAAYFVDTVNGLLWWGSRLYPYPWWPGVNNIIVVAQIGMASIPANLKQAANELIRFWWQQGRQGNVPWQMPDQQQPGAARVPQGFAVPSRVIALARSGDRNRMHGFA